MAKRQALMPSMRSDTMISTWNNVLLRFFSDDSTQELFLFDR